MGFMIFILFDFDFDFDFDFIRPTIRGQDLSIVLALYACT